MQGVATSQHFYLLQATESECGDMDLSGLPETAVDSDEDDDEDVGRGTDPLMSRDIVRDCLEKDPMDRTDDDIGKTRFSVFVVVLDDVASEFIVLWFCFYVYRAAVGVRTTAPGIRQSERFGSEGAVRCYGVCSGGTGRNHRAESW